MHNQTKQSSRDKKTSSKSTIVRWSEWMNKHQRSIVLRAGVILISIALFLAMITFAIRRIESTWYFIDLDTSRNGTSVLTLIIFFELLRWLFFASLSILILLFVVTPESSSYYAKLSAFILRYVFMGALITYAAIGLENLVLYNSIGWKYLSPVRIGEGVSLVLAWLLISSVVIGSKLYSTKKIIVLESLFNLFLILTPIAFILIVSTGGFQTVPNWYIIVGILVCLSILLIGVDEIRGKPSLYTDLVAMYRILEAGHVSLQSFRKQSAEALANALLVYKRLPAEEQESLAKWILDNNKPAFINRFWALAKIIVSAILLTILIQEPAIIVFKWFLKTVFNFTY